MREKEAGDGPGKAKNRPDGVLNFKMRKLTKEPRQGRGIQAAGGGVFQQPAKGVPNLVSAKERLESKNELCGHYFRVLYQLLKFIATNCPGGKIGSEFDSGNIKNTLPSDEEKMYSNIVRSFIGYEITQLLAINCFCASEDDSYWKYKLLIERYEFLEHMPFKINGEDHVLLNEAKTTYQKKAFGHSEFVPPPVKA